MFQSFFDDNVSRNDKINIGNTIETNIFIFKKLIHVR